MFGETANESKGPELAHGEPRKRLRGLKEKVDRLLGVMPARVQVAALPWRRGPDGVEVLLITSRERGRWVLPKGWPERDETYSQAAAREASEEAGIAGAVTDEQVGRYVYSKVAASGRKRPCQVHVFPMEIREVHETWPERHQRVRGWFSTREAASMVDEPDLREMIARFGAGAA
jgi:8-oxo-dGTP pyrophosphatase MutT (NUDIX family)